MLDEPDRWKQRFFVPRLLWCALASQRPERGLVCINSDGTHQLHSWCTTSGALSPLTSLPGGKQHGTLSPDGEHVYYFDDPRGCEEGHVVRIPYEGGIPASLTPDLPPFVLQGFGLSGSGNGLTIGAGHEADYRLWHIDLHPDATFNPPRLLSISDSYLSIPHLSYDGQLVVTSTSVPAGRSARQLMAIDTRTADVVAALDDGPGSRMTAFDFSPVHGDARLLVRSDRPAGCRLLSWNPLTGETTELDMPDQEGTVTSATWSSDAQQVLLGWAHESEIRQHVYDLRSGESNVLAEISGAGGFCGFAQFSPNGEVLAIREDESHPPELIALQPSRAAVSRVVIPAPPCEPGRTWRSVQIPVSDDVQIQGWLGVPAGRGPFPAIVEVHGGPFDVATRRFSPEGQAWIDNGFAYLTINYRGSSTFGRRFMMQILRNPGALEVADMAASRDWLVRQNIADPESVFASGWSYGGYLTLLAMGVNPDLWAGGMAGTATTDWALQDEDLPPARRQYSRAYFGGAGPADEPWRYAVSSPLTYCGRVQAPVLIIQGRNDTRCPPRQVELYEQRMVSLGKQIEVHWYDYGHLAPSADAGLAVRSLELMLRFARDVVATRGLESEHTR